MRPVSRARLGRSGNGMRVRTRRGSGYRWNFRTLQLRILLLALLLGTIAWSQLPG